MHYPGDDFKDLMAGVDDLIARGWVDPDKLGVTGGSGGGVLTNWTVGHTTRFKAAVIAALHRRLARTSGTPPISLVHAILVPRRALGAGGGFQSPFADHLYR